MPVANPVEYTYTSSDSSNTGSTAKSIPHPPPVSKVTHVISGLKTIVYGLAEISSSATDIACLWMLHPRLQTQECMAPFAAQFIHNWNARNSSKRKGLIAVSFDQRNHGTREISAIANEAWRSGNEKHAQDMFSCFHGTSTDTSQLLDHIPGYIFPDPADIRALTHNIVFGISLGAHAAWHVVMQDQRFSTAIITIGCPDYTRLMSDRARLSKRKTWTDSQGRDFVGSSDFPSGLVEAVRQYDPAGLLFGTLLEKSPRRKRGQEHVYNDLTDEEREVLLPLMTKTLSHKRIINLSGGADKLVPYAQGKPFLDWLKASIAPDGFFTGNDLVLEDIVVNGAGHEVPPAMVEHMQRFLFETLENERCLAGAGKPSRRDSRI
ncbi:hypothetical protein LTS08_008262 [Lithohypha guttulata]|uniref:AB hydrolase-1 domain-containing protein n=1 Tax=Lithohypha guttulata TaxID=1690604 RepID=A0AAN7T147_9EURO|nr:hypothetical protein LTR05_004024 [Lithohypha guttulata]KAK5095102.1 hypothetical protein LTS08_008262 [Lithohypha guttulata]